MDAALSAASEGHHACGVSSGEPPAGKIRLYEPLADFVKSAISCIADLILRRMTQYQICDAAKNKQYQVTDSFCDPQQRKQLRGSK